MHRKRNVLVSLWYIFGCGKTLQQKYIYVALRSLSNYRLLYQVECADLIVVFESHATVGQLFHPFQTSCVSKEDEWGSSLKMLHMRGAMRH